MSNWQPIETAPKDGTRILLFDPSDDDGESVKLGHFVLPVYRAQGSGGWLCNRADWMALHEPSHWMPLPETPTKGEG
jgi:hypothetical protein